MTHKIRCKHNWSKLGIKDNSALKEHIKRIFERHRHQRDALVDIYKLVYPKWDHIEKIDGYPEVGNELWKFICRGFIAFDKKHHPNVFKGGIWMNNGFSSNSLLDPWELSLKNCRIYMK